MHAAQFCSPRCRDMFTKAQDDMGRGVSILCNNVSR